MNNTHLMLVVTASGIAFGLMRIWLPAPLDRFLKFVKTRVVWVTLCALFLVAYVILLICSTTYVGYLDHVEANIAAVSAILLKGAPLYHDVKSAARYTIPYGPMAYLPYSLALRVFGAHILSVKVVVLLANSCLLWMLWSCYRKLLDRSAALLVMVSVIACLLIRPSRDYVFQVRGDILLIFCVGLGLYAVLCTSPWVSVFLLALACSFSLDIKVSAPLYFLPLFVLFIRRHGLRCAVWASIGAAVLAVVPFLFPQVSLSQYLVWLHMAFRLPHSRQAVGELQVLLVVCGPVGLLLWQLARTNRHCLNAYLKKNWSFLTALIGSVAAMALTMAPVVGAGLHHLLPFYPLLGYLCADIYREAAHAKVGESRDRRVRFVPLLWFWLVLVITVRLRTGISPTVWKLLTSRPQANAVTSDLQMVMKSYPGAKIEMGYGNSLMSSRYWLANFRPVLVFAGNPLTIEANAMDIMQLMGLDIPPSTLEYLQACKTQIWLIPKGETPFGLLNYLALLDTHAHKLPLFSGQFQQIFYQQYRKQEPSKYFDIWECKSD